MEHKKLQINILSALVLATCINIIATIRICLYYYTRNF